MTTPQVISVSRRTDIPAFYTKWFMNRIHAGYARYRNPFGGQVYEVSLKPEDVIAFVFWSRNYEPLLPHLPQLEQLGYHGYFHFTITGLGSPLEPHVPQTSKAVGIFKTLTARYSPKHILWRFDPMIFSNKTSEAYLLEQFDSLAQLLSGYTERCYISFVDFYNKTRKNLQLLAGQGMQFREPEIEEKIALVQQLVGIGNTYQLEIHACCESDLLQIPGVKQAHCVDALLLHELFPEKFRSLKKAPTRKGCGCFSSRDIGAYDTCVYGCAYCYANTSHQKALTHYTHHDPESPEL